jgi:tetratricopeptide (TPR) repeat protein
LRRKISRENIRRLLKEPPQTVAQADVMCRRHRAAHELYLRGRELMDARNFEDAIAILDRSASLEPHFKTPESLGECYLLLGRLREAVVPLAAATSLNEAIPRTGATCRRTL